MINSLQKRHQSKSLKSQLSQPRPITRQNDQQQAEKCFQMAKQHQSRNQLQKAQKLYMQAVIHNPAHFKSYCNLGLCYKLRSQYPNSIQAYKQSLAITPLDPITNYNLANVYRLIGDQEKSIEHYLVVINLKEKQQIDVGSLYLDSYNNLGICYKNIENYTEAIQIFEKIINDKPSEDSVKFNLAVCYLRVIRQMAKNSNNQNSMLIRQNISKTTNLFQQVIKNQPKNEVALLALLEIGTLANQDHENIKKCVTELDSIMNSADASGFAKQQGSKIKAHCLNLMAKYEQSAEEYRKAMQRKKEEDEKIMALEKQKKKAAEQKEKQQAKKIAEQTKVATSTKAMDPVAQSAQSTKTLPTEPAINAQQVFQKMSSQLLQNIKSILGDASKLSKQKNISQTVAKMIESLQKEHLANNKDKELGVRLNKQLSIIGANTLGEHFLDKHYFTHAYNTYLNYFLKSTLATPVSKSTLFLQTHRAIAAALTSLGHSQKAIEHYQIISQQFSDKNMRDQDPLQQLHSGLAVNYESQGLHQKAILEFRQAIRLNPSNYVFYYNLGYCQHCAGLDGQAVASYAKFLEQIQKETSIDTASKHSYILQAMISILICSQGSVEQKISQCNKIESKMEEFCGPDPQAARRLVNHQSLMRYYLTACDLYEQTIFNLQKSPKQTSKQHKEKLFIIYVKLLDLPNCPDRNQILINCGNLLFEEREYLGAMELYQKVSKTKTQVFNIIALTLMNINEHQRAINCMEFAFHSDKQNKIYEVNFQIMKWAYGLETSSKQNLLWSKLSCQCDLEFDTRVEYAKLMIIKLTALIQLQITSASSMESLTVEKIFTKLLSEKEQTHLLKEPQTLLKHNIVKQHIQQHCSKVHNTPKQNTIDFSVIKEILTAITELTEVNNQNINKLLTTISQKLNQTTQRQSSDYLNVLEHSLALFLYTYSQDPAKLKTLQTTIQSKNPNIPTYELTFSDPSVSNSDKYPQKNYTVPYPAIELKLQNLIQSLLSWNTTLEGQFVYLLKIIEPLAYKSKLRSPLLIDYNFPYCKNVQNCQKCFKKAIYVLSHLFNLNCKYNFTPYLKDELSLPSCKKSTYTSFLNKFGKNLEPILTTTQGKDAKSLTIKLNNQTLPLQLQANFQTQNDFESFLKNLSSELSTRPPVYNKNDKQLYLVLNKLVRIRCAWKQTDYTEEMLTTLAKSPLGLRQNSVQFFESQVLKQWLENQSLKPLLAKSFDPNTFLK